MGAAASERSPRATQGVGVRHLATTTTYLASEGIGETDG
jgi:hypothetical protein